MSQYREAWNVLKTTGKLELVVSREHAHATEHGIKVVKSAENTARKAVGLIGWSKLVIKREILSNAYVKITMTFLYSTDL